MKEVNRKAIADGDQTGRIANVLECTSDPWIFGLVALNADGSGIASGKITVNTGTTGTDFNVAGSPVWLWETLTLNIPDASTLNRGLITIGVQTIAGAKTFSATPTFSTMTLGSVFFAWAAWILSQNNANFFRDDTNTRLWLLTNAPHSTLDNRGSEASNTVTITANYTALATDHIIRCNHTAPITVTFPTVVWITWRKYIVEDVSGNGSVNHITLVPAGWQTVNNELNYSMMWDFRSLEIMSDWTSNWNIIRWFADNFFQGNNRFCSIFPTNSARDETWFSTLTTVWGLVTSFIATGWWFRAFNTVTTAAAVGSFGGVSNGNTFNLAFTRQQEPTFSWIIRTGAVITTQRIWIGFTNIIPSNSDTLPGSGICFRYSTVAADTTRKYVTRDWVTQSVADSGIAVTASTTYRLKLRFDNTNGRALFSIDEMAETAVTLNLPAIGLWLWMSARINNTVWWTTVAWLISFIKWRYT